ncbi:dienelactone hydrolase family protein [Corynebacterium sp. MNWGS58]|uniref:dienelactone hydrolase family protein n=1 Tax=Corynebacterium sp. 102791.4 TaxID=3104612 RepID=UPI0035127A42
MSLKKHLANLSKRGPHRVLVGDLDYAGLPGKIYAPAEGSSLPAVAFGHDWRVPLKHYRQTLRHLASWGIVAVAPETETGLWPDHRAFASDLETSLQIAAGVKLGQGNITVSPNKLAVIGHGMGGGTAVLAALENEKVCCVGALYPAQTSPSSQEAAKYIDKPGLIIGPEKSDIFSAGNPPELAKNWKGEVCYRAVDNGKQATFTEDTLRKLFLGIGVGKASAVETARGLTTGFLLHQLNGDKKYADFSDPEAAGKGFVSATGEELNEHQKPDGLLSKLT